jgi:hypothetical protein
LIDYNFSVRRRLFNFASTVSLLICLTTAVLWVRSYWFSDDIRCRTGTSRIAFRCGAELYRGGLFLELDWEDVQGSYKAKTEVKFEDTKVRPAIEPDLAPSTFLGFRYEDHPIVGGTWFVYRHELEIPMWFLVLAFTLMPASKAVRLRYRKTGVSMLCSVCSYNLTGNVSRVCPECGTRIQQQISS